MHLRALAALASLFALAAPLPTTQFSDEAATNLTAKPPGRDWPWPEGFPHYTGDADMTETECGLFKFGNRKVADKLISQLESYHALETCTCSIPSRTCCRQACEDTTAIYVCNHSYDIQSTRSNLSYRTDIAPWARKLFDACADWPLADGSISGELTEKWGFTVVIGHGNCGADIDAGPEMMPMVTGYKA
ncbi:hypothetical protein QBC37DRAFT_77696 [Rhypophila decipiens]|uniref:Uncharacterized protein n=1 Tax=Rhypophila decipiens TaxID=261697 RepID=A0AAN7BDF1_9PEZI|nr:hypothetical protein QBC37DRAFT_77696 [Rhypophila decipiens]